MPAAEFLSRSPSHRLARFTLALTLLAGTAGHASPLQLLEGSLDIRSVSARSRLARELATEVAGTLRRVGAPSAGETAAVLEEMSAIGGLRDPAAVNARAYQLYGSPSFQQLRLYNTLSAVREALDCAAAATRSVSREMACWAIAGNALSERVVFEDALAALARGGRLPHDGGMTRARWTAAAARWARYGHAIHDCIVIPYLRGALD